MTLLSTYFKKSFRKAFKTVGNQDGLTEMKAFKPITFSQMVQKEFEKINDPQILLQQ